MTPAVTPVLGGGCEAWPREKYPVRLGGARGRGLRRRLHIGRVASGGRPPVRPGGSWTNCRRRPTRSRCRPSPRSGCRHSASTHNACGTTAYPRRSIPNPTGTGRMALRRPVAGRPTWDSEGQRPSPSATRSSSRGSSSDGSETPDRGGGGRRRSRGRRRRLVAPVPSGQDPGYTAGRERADRGGRAHRSGRTRADSRHARLSGALAVGASGSAGRAHRGRRAGHHRPTWTDGVRGGRRSGGAVARVTAGVAGIRPRHAARRGRTAARAEPCRARLQGVDSGRPVHLGDPGGDPRVAAWAAAPGDGQPAIGYRRLRPGGRQGP